MKQQSSISYAFIDSQIIQYFADKNKSKEAAFQKLFKKLEKQGLVLAISEIVIFENLFAQYGNKQKDGYTYLSRFLKKAVDARTLLAAAKIGGLYKDEGFTEGKSIDQIIAATVLQARRLVSNNL